MNGMYVTLIATLFATGCTGAQAAAPIEGEWRLFEPEMNSPSLVEMGFFYGEDVHAEPYMTCARGSGWLKISQGMADDYEGVMRLKVAEISLELPSTMREDMGVSVEAMMPTDHPILKATALGKELQIDGFRYVAESGEERDVIRQFIAQCRLD